MLAQLNKENMYMEGRVLAQLHTLLRVVECARRHKAHDHAQVYVQRMSRMGHDAGLVIVQRPMLKVGAERAHLLYQHGISALLAPLTQYHRMCVFAMARALFIQQMSQDQVHVRVLCQRFDLRHIGAQRRPRAKHATQVDGHLLGRSQVLHVDRAARHHLPGHNQENRSQGCGNTHTQKVDGLERRRHGVLVHILQRSFDGHALPHRRTQDLGELCDRRDIAASAQGTEER